MPSSFPSATCLPRNNPMRLFLACLLLAAAAPDSLEIGYQGAGMVEWMARRSIPGTIYAGTSEVQRSIIAESGLKLPRTRG